MRPTVRYRGSADQLLANLFSLSIVTFPLKVFAKVNSAQFFRGGEWFFKNSGSRKILVEFHGSRSLVF